MAIDKAFLQECLATSVHEEVIAHKSALKRKNVRFPNRRETQENQDMQRPEIFEILTEIHS